MFRDVPGTNQDTLPSPDREQPPSYRSSHHGTGRHLKAYRGHRTKVSDVPGLPNIHVFRWRKFFAGMHTNQQRRSRRG